jgi:hypothetical protein
LESATVFVGEGVPSRASRKSRIPIRLKEVKGRPGTGKSTPKTKNEKLKQSKSEPVFEDDFDDESDEETANLDVNAVSIKRKIGDDEEEELELVFIDGLGCYYCPANQQYYEIDD